MNTGIKKAAVSAAARTNELHRKSYLKPAILSSLKIKIGQLLFRLDENDKQDWQWLENVLRQYIDLKLNGVKL